MSASHQTNGKKIEKGTIENVFRDLATFNIPQPPLREFLYSILRFRVSQNDILGQVLLTFLHTIFVLVFILKSGNTSLV